MGILSMIFGPRAPQMDAVQKPPVFRYKSVIAPDENYTVIDVETSGLDPSCSDLLEIGAVRYRNHVQVAKFQSYIRPTGRIPAEATHVNHIRWSDVSDAPFYEDIINQFMEFIGSDTLVGYNIEFDIRFLQTRGQCSILNGCFDVLKLARFAYPNLSRYRLDDMRDHLHIYGPSHNAIDDCIATAEVLQHSLQTDYGKYILGRAEEHRQHEAERAEKREQLLAQKAERIKVASTPCEWDTMDDSCYKCFVAGISPTNARYIKNQSPIIDCISAACKDHGGHYYKTAAKGAVAVVLLGISEQNADRAAFWREQGYKIISPSDFLVYCGSPELLTPENLSAARNCYLEDLKKNLGCS